MGRNDDQNRKKINEMQAQTEKERKLKNEYENQLRKIEKQVEENKAAGRARAAAAQFQAHLRDREITRMTNLEAERKAELQDVAQRLQMNLELKEKEIIRLSRANGALKVKYEYEEKRASDQQSSVE